MSSYLFQDRSDAGKKLADKLTIYANNPNAIVLGLPRGGIPVAYEIASKLNLPLDACLVRKLGVPGHPELAFGALSLGGTYALNDDVVNYQNISQSTIEESIAYQTREINRQNEYFRQNRPAPNLAGKIVILVDDGLATGATMRAAIAPIKKQSPKQIIVAVPVGPSETLGDIAPLVDEVVCLIVPTYFNAVGNWYTDFAQTTDDEVLNYLLESE